MDFKELQKKMADSAKNGQKPANHKPIDFKEIAERAKNAPKRSANGANLSEMLKKMQEKAKAAQEAKKEAEKQPKAKKKTSRKK